jgi:hypothetical protein
MGGWFAEGLCWKAWNARGQRQIELLEQMTVLTGGNTPLRVSDLPHPCTRDSVDGNEEARQRSWLHEHKRGSARRWSLTRAFGKYWNYTARLWGLRSQSGPPCLLQYPHQRLHPTHNSPEAWQCIRRLPRRRFVGRIWYPHVGGTWGYISEISGQGQKVT